jgi:hypothetical protein
MTPVTMVALAAAAAVLGMGVGRSQERLLRRAGGPRGTSAMVDVGLARLRWVAPAVVASLVLKAALSDQPPVALAWVPLALVGPWLVAVHYVGFGTADRVLAVAGFFTANLIIVAVAFTGDAAALLTAPLGMVLVAGLALLGRRLLGDAVGVLEVKVAALVGLASGSLGWPAVALAVLWAVVALATTWVWGRSRFARVAPALLAGAWVAALATL